MRARKLSLQGFSKEVSNHLFRWTMFDGQVLHVDAVSDEIESAVEMLGSLTAGLATIVLKKNRTLVVLTENGILMTTASCFEKAVSP